MAALAAYDTAEETWGTAHEALGLAIAVLKKTKTRSWAELCAAALPGTPTGKLLAGIDLSPGQLSVLEVHRDVVALLRVTPNAIPAICSACGMPTLVDTTAPASCPITLRCEGKPIKPAAAKKVDAAPTRPPLVIEEPEADAQPLELEDPDAENDAELAPETAPSEALVEVPAAAVAYDSDFPDDFEPAPSRTATSAPTAPAEAEELVDFDFD